MTIIRPKALKEGDKIGIVAPSMHVIDEDAVQQGIKKIKDLNFDVEYGENVFQKYRNTTATPKERAKEVMDFFERRDIKGIVCLIGGDSVVQLLRLIDYRIIRDNPKVFCGMSDITHLHLAFLTRANMMSLHGPDLTFGFGASENKDALNYNVDLFMRCCTVQNAIGKMPAFGEWECWRPGFAEGRLVGGWIGAVAGLAGTKYWPSIDNIILFWEAFGKEPHDIERTFELLKANDFFDKVRGMIVGKLVECEEKTYENLMPSIKELVLEITSNYNIPIIGNVDFGHDLTNMPIPLGMLSRIDSNSSIIEFLEPYVI
jgi:muramoyltetrapeptide carboxypeptidase